MLDSSEYKWRYLNSPYRLRKITRIRQQSVRTLTRRKLTLAQRPLAWPVSHLGDPKQKTADKEREKNSAEFHYVHHYACSQVFGLPLFSSRKLGSVQRLAVKVHNGPLSSPISLHTVERKRGLWLTINLFYAESSHIVKTGHDCLKANPVWYSAKL